MNRGKLYILALMASLSALPARAVELVDQILAELRADGYSQFEVSRTLLGRTHISAQSLRYGREIVINPRTGEILRDYRFLLASGDGAEDQLLLEDDASGPGSGGSGSGGSGSGSNSGSGGSGSNSGSGGSGSNSGSGGSGSNSGSGGSGSGSNSGSGGSGSGSGSGSGGHGSDD